MRPIQHGRGIRQTRHLYASGFIDRFHDYREWFTQDTNGFDVRRHGDDILFFIHDELRLVAVLPLNASLTVISGTTHIRAVHQTW